MATPVPDDKLREFLDKAKSQSDDDVRNLETSLGDSLDQVIKNWQRLRVAREQRDALAKLSEKPK